MPARTRRQPSADVPAPEFEQVADELYGLPEQEFTATRTRYERQAKQAGDRDLAARIHALAKPNVTAWVANQLAREHHDELQPLLELGAGLQQATRQLDGEQLRQLSRQQYELVSALVQQGRQLARAAGRTISDDTARGLEDTFRAALADGHAAQLLLAGRLTKALTSEGFPSTPETGGATGPIPPRPARPAAAPSERGTERRLQAERDVTDAERTVGEADRAHADARAQLKQAEQATAESSKQIEDLRRRLDAALNAESDAERHRRSQVGALQRTERALNDARRRQAAARARRDRLLGDE